MQPIGRLWLNALQMTVVPLVLALVIVGVNTAADAAATGRVARRAIVVFLLILAGAAAMAAVLAPAADMAVDFAGLKSGDTLRGALELLSNHLPATDAVVFTIPRSPIFGYCRVPQPVATSPGASMIIPWLDGNEI